LNGSTLIVERHSWRGFKTVGGELGIARTMGFFTFTYCPFLLSTWIDAKISLMRDLLKTQPSTNADQNTKAETKLRGPIHVTTLKGNTNGNCK
jgi:hypothetical protein